MYNVFGFYQKGEWSALLQAAPKNNFIEQKKRGE